MILAHVSAAQENCPSSGKSPSLKRELSEMAVESYGDAVLSAAREKSFPSEMPWALADALRDDFIPD